MKDYIVKVFHDYKTIYVCCLFTIFNSSIVLFLRNIGVVFINSNDEWGEKCPILIHVAWERCNIYICCMGRNLVVFFVRREIKKV